MPHRRLRLLRETKKSAYFDVISEIADRSDQQDRASLKAILSDHWRWHHGEYEGLDDLFKHEVVSHHVSALQRIYRAFLLNTTGRLRESSSLLAALGAEDSQVLAYLSDFLGESASSVISTWEIWNSVEALDASAFHCGIVKCGAQLSDSRVLNRSKAQFCLAVGVGALRFDNHKLSRLFLDRAENFLLQGSVWLPRVASAQALLALKDNDEARGRHWLGVARRGLTAHFGPMGWQLRIAEAHWLLNEKEPAIKIIEDVLARCLEKKENIYSGWARIFLLELTGSALNKDSCFPFGSPYCECRRLQLYCLKRGLLEYD